MHAGYSRGLLALRVSALYVSRLVATFSGCRYRLFLFELRVVVLVHRLAPCPFVGRSLWSLAVLLARALRALRGAAAGVWRLVGSLCPGALCWPCVFRPRLGWEGTPVARFLSGPPHQAPGAPVRGDVSLARRPECWGAQVACRWSRLRCAGARVAQVGRCPCLSSVGADGVCVRSVRVRSWPWLS